VLLTAAGVVKVADFGHACRFPDGVAGTSKPQHHEVVTIWYRPPELLFRARAHGPPVDMWSVGCILGELLLRQPLFPAHSHSDRDQMAVVIRLLGSPHDPLAALSEPARSAPPSARQQAANSAGTGGYSIAAAATMAAEAGGWEPAPDRSSSSSSSSSSSGGATGDEVPDSGSSTAAAALPPAALPPPPRPTEWPGCTSLPGYAEFEPRPTQPWADILRSSAVAGGGGGSHAQLAVDLLARLLVYDPAARLTAAEALAHPWFAAAPEPTPAGQLPLPAAARLQAAAMAGAIAGAAEGR